MAEKTEKKPAEKEKTEAKPEKSEGKAAKGGGLMSKTPVLLGGAMVIEAIVLFAGFKMLGGGAKHAAANETEVATATDTDTKSDSDKTSEKSDKPSSETAENKGEASGDSAKPGEIHSHDKRKKAELTVVDFRAPNKQGGRTFLYDVNICISIRADAEEKIKTVLKDNDALVKDRIRTIIAESDPEKLGGGSEPGLETLRRQVKYQLDEIVGPDIIDEVLVPRCIPYPVNY